MNATLNMEAGGEISANFRRLYNYFHVRLRQANFKKEREPIEETLQRLRVMRDSWAEILRRPPSGRADYADNPGTTAVLQAAAA